MENEKLALKTALNLINRRWYSIEGIREKLQIKKFTEEEIEKTLQFLVEKDFLNDIRFAKLFIKDHQNLQHQGKIVINLKLFQKGISKDDMKIAWQEYEEEYGVDEVKIAADLIRRKLKSPSMSTNYQLLTAGDQRRLLGFLSRKGFTYDTIKKALANIDDGIYN